MKKSLGTIKKVSKGGFKSEGTGGFLLLQKNIPNLYPEQKIWISFSLRCYGREIQIFCSIQWFGIFILENWKSSNTFWRKATFTYCGFKHLDINRKKNLGCSWQFFHFLSPRQLMLENRLMNGSLYQFSIL